MVGADWGGIKLKQCGRESGKYRAGGGASNREERGGQAVACAGQPPRQSVNRGGGILGGAAKHS